MEHQELNLLDTRPVLMNTIHAGYSIAADWAEGEQELRRILDTHREPLFFVNDIREMKMSIDDLVAAASMGSRGQDPIWHHPNMRGVYFISDSTLIKMAAAGLNHPAFGNTKVQVFGSVEEALADIESRMQVT